MNPASGHARAPAHTVVDRLADRLDMARAQGAETINFDEENPVEAIMALTAGIGVDRVVDAVGVDAVHAQRGPASSSKLSQQGENESRTVTPKRNDGDGHWIPGDAPTQALDWGVSALAKAGTRGVIGVYPPTDRFFPIGAAMNKNLIVKMRNCNHRAVTPDLIERVRNGSFDPLRVLTSREPLMHVIDAYKAFDQRQPGWIKVALEPLA